MKFLNIITLKNPNLENKKKQISPHDKRLLFKLRKICEFIPF